MSSEDGVSTAYTSRQLSQLILKLFHLPQNQHSQVDQTIRTLAHFVGFFVMGGVSYTASKATWADSKCLVFKVITAGAALAILDEVKKLFIKGRHLSWPEAGLNVIGIVCGVLFSLWILRLIARAKKVNR